MDDELPHYCCCNALADFVLLPMGGNGLDRLVLASFKEVAAHGNEKWWLHVSVCLVCRQHWMVAQDERIYDNYYLRRVSPGVVSEIVDLGWWPEEFLTYERVLTLGKKSGHLVQFLDPQSPALASTVDDLRRERPEITVGEIAHLLAIPEGNVVRLLG